MLQYVVHNFLLRRADQDDSLSTIINDAACIIASLFFSQDEETKRNKPNYKEREVINRIRNKQIIPDRK
jgi:hypothetical protein